MLPLTSAIAFLRRRDRLFCALARNHFNFLGSGNRGDLGRISLLLNSRPILRRDLITDAPNILETRRWIRTSGQLRQYARGPGGNEGGPDDEQKRLMKFLFFSGGVLLVLLLLRLRAGESPEGVPSQVVSWNDFVHEMLAKGEVEEIVIRPDMELALIKLYPNAVYRGRPVATIFPFQMRIANVGTFEEQLRKAEMQLGIPPDKGVSVVYERQYSGEWVMLALLVIASYLIYRRLTRNVYQAAGAKGPARGGFDLFGGIRKARFRLVDPLLRTGTPKVTFADVAGLHEAKVEVKEFVDYLKRPENYTRLGAKLPKGALLLGPPGCGKTLLAKAVATEANVPFLAMNGTEFVEMIGGLGAARVRDLFSEAKRRAPCIIYIDEIDAVGKKRSGEGAAGGGGAGFAGSGEEEQTLNQLLVEMDGMDTAQGVIMLASTNRPDILDKALLRRGRFDRHISIDMPTLAERRELFEYYLKKIKLEGAMDKYAHRLSQLTPGFTGADINNICNEAALHAATAGQKAVTNADLTYALDRVLSGPEKKSVQLAPEDREVVAYHESGHALVGWMLEHTDLLLKVSIVPRTVAALGFAQYNPQDRKLYSKEELFERMCMTLGGRAAEVLRFGRVTTGAEDDLRKVTRIAYDQIRAYGMSANVGPLSFAAPPGMEREAQFYKKPYSKKLQSLIDHEATQLVGTAYRKAQSVLKENVDKLEKIAQALLKNEVLTYEQMIELIGPPPFPHKSMVETVSLSLPTPQEIPGLDDSPPPPSPMPPTKEE